MLLSRLTSTGFAVAIRLDNGPELTADAFADWAEKNGVMLLFIQPGKPSQNAFIERFNRSFRQEVLDAWLFNAISEVQDAADAWLTDYNEYRPNDSEPPRVPWRPVGLSHAGVAA